MNKYKMIAMCSFSIVCVLILSLILPLTIDASDKESLELKMHFENSTVTTNIIVNSDIYTGVVCKYIELDDVLTEEDLPARTQSEGATVNLNQTSKDNYEAVIENVSKRYVVIYVSIGNCELCDYIDCNPSSSNVENTTETEQNNNSQNEVVNEETKNNENQEISNNENTEAENTDNNNENQNQTSNSESQVVEQENTTSEVVQSQTSNEPIVENIENNNNVPNEFETIEEIQTEQNSTNNNVSDENNVQNEVIPEAAGESQPITDEDPVQSEETANVVQAPSVINEVEEQNNYTQPIELQSNSNEQVNTNISSNTNTQSTNISNNKETIDINEFQEIQSVDKNVTADSGMPQTGENDSIKIAGIVVFSIISVISFYKYKKER